MSKERNSLIKRDDFVEIKYLILVKNSTTKTEVKAAEAVTIAELRERGLVLRLPSGACMSGHMLLLQILPKTNLVPKQRPPRHLSVAPGGGRKPASKSHEQLVKEKELAAREFQAAVIEITAKVHLVQIADDGSLHVEVNFYQFDEKKWQKFVASFSERQNTIHRIVKAVKE
ncbi:MAG: hypothetical protein HY075_15390 [Deltaproteobacteria bacterium]|nr:hypothetical protein [Deltaproteobacteria bacterium]